MKFVFFFKPFKEVFLSFISLYIRSHHCSDGTADSYPRNLFAQFLEELTELIIFDIKLLLTFRCTFHTIF